MALASTHSAPCFTLRPGSTSWPSVSARSYPSCSIDAQSSPVQGALGSAAPLPPHLTTVYFVFGFW
eukprot:2409712-Pyramimonas_sp.AAC.1